MGVILAPGGAGLALYNGNLINPSTPISGGRLTLAGPGQMIGGTPSISGNDGARITINTPGGAIEARQNVVPAVWQTDPVDIAGITAPIPLVLSLGAVLAFLDIGGTNLAIGDVLMIDPNGIAHDLFSLVVDKSTGDGFLGTIPNFPAGIYSFYNQSGGALTVDGVMVRHLGARNLA